MTDKEPTEEVWVWCGFIEHLGKEMWQYEPYKQTNHWWEAPNGRRYKDLPPIDLNNLFKYAVPIALDKLVQQGFTLPLMRLFQLWYDQIVKINGNSLDLTNCEMALFRVIWEVMHNEKAVK